MHIISSVCYCGSELSDVVHELNVCAHQHPQHQRRVVASVFCRGGPQRVQVDGAKGQRGIKQERRSKLLYSAQTRREPYLSSRPALPELSGPPPHRPSTVTDLRGEGRSEPVGRRWNVYMPMPGVSFDLCFLFFCIGRLRRYDYANTAA